MFEIFLRTFSMCLIEKIEGWENAKDYDKRENLKSEGD